MNSIEFLYYLGLSAKKYVALKTGKKLPCRVISIGNITVGGTGKTPATVAVAEEAIIRGFSPIILTRGYRGTEPGPCFVTRGEVPLLTAEQAGDEPLLMAERLKGVPIVKGADRYEAGMFALKELGVQSSACKVAEDIKSVHLPIPNTQHPTPVFILDDGFQHWKLHRDRDIVLIDAKNPFGNRKLLPVGRLREPLSELRRADSIVITKAAREDSALIAEVRKYNSRAPIFFARHRAVAVRSRTGERRPLEWLTDRKVFCFCGLADPESFRDTAASAGAVITGMKVFRDHYRYQQYDIATIVKECKTSGASWIIATEKDMVKLRNLDLPENILIIEMAFAAGQPFYESVFS